MSGATADNDDRSPMRRRIRYLFESPFRRPGLVLAPAALLSLTAGAIAQLSPSLYRASALLRAEWDTTDDALLRQKGIDVVERRNQAVRQRVLGPASITRLQRRTELRSQDGRVPTREEVESWLRTVRVEPQGTSVIEIECVQPDAARAVLVTNLLAADLVDETQVDEGPPASVEAQRLAAALAEASRTLEASRTALENAQQPPAPSPIPSPTEDTQQLLQQAERAAAEKRQTASALASARARAERLQATIAANGPDGASLAADPDTELKRLRDELAALRKQYTEEHPDVERLALLVQRAERAAAARQAASPRPEPQEVAELQEVEAEISALTTKLAALDAGDRHVDKPAASLPAPDSQADQQRLATEYERARSAYDTLLKDWRAAEQAARLGGGPIARFEVVRSASAPVAEPSGLVLWALGGAAVGLALGLVLALVAEIRDRTVKGPEDLAEILPLPLLATTPPVRGRRKTRPVD